MTPFGEKLRQYRFEKNITQKQMAKMIHVSPAYLSALESGKRGVPSYRIVQNICGILGIIWDEADALIEIANISHPKPIIDTTQASALATEVANLLAKKINALNHADLCSIKDILRKY